MRVTQKTLEEKAITLNRIAGVDPGEEFRIDCAYDAYALVQGAGAGSTGERDTFGRDSAKIVYNQLQGMIAGVDLAKKQAQASAVDRFLMVSDNDRAAYDALLGVIESAGFQEQENALATWLDDLLDDIQIRADLALPRELQEFRALLVSQFVADMRHNLDVYAIASHYRDKLRAEQGSPRKCRITGCDCQNEIDGEELAQLRALPLPGGGNAILCHECYSAEIDWRKTRNGRIDPAAAMDLPAWEDLPVSRP